MLSWMQLNLAFVNVSLSSTRTGDVSAAPARGREPVYNVRVGRRHGFPSLALWLCLFVTTMNSCPSAMSPCFEANLVWTKTLKNYKLNLSVLHFGHFVSTICASFWVFWLNY